MFDRKLLPRAAALALAVSVLLAGCASAPRPANDGLRIVATTGILTDLARNVAGDRAMVTTIVPDGTDPHDYEPTLHDVRDIASAEVALSHYPLLEGRGIVAAIEANLPPSAQHVSLAETSVAYAAEIIPLVEDASLDTVWLGATARGDGAGFGADRTSDVLLSVTGVRGPGELHAYLTGAFGDVRRFVDSSDGFDATTGFRDDTLTLPPDAHTHLSWAFSAAGVYEVDVSARLQVTPQSRSVPLAAGTVTFAVGVDPYEVADRANALVLASGHADLAVDLDAGDLRVLLDREHGADHRHHHAGAGHTSFALDRIVVQVPGTTMHEVPDEASFRFLGEPGSRVYQLPQAVLGAHVHGEIDPHLWHDVRNAMAYVEIIRDTLVAADPEGAQTYRARAGDYLRELDALDAEVRATIAGIPPARRMLVTTHDAFRYLASAYGLTVAGVVTPHPSGEPSLADRRRLTETIGTLGVPAVFLEPDRATRSSVLREVADEQGVRVCPIYGGALDADAPTYADMMRANARSLAGCLSG